MTRMATLRAIGEALRLLNSFSSAYKPTESCRFFTSSPTSFKVPNAAKVMVKLMRGSSKPKWVWRDHSANTNDVTECFGLQPQGNRKVAHRRVTVLNSVFYERITDLLSTSEIDDGLQDMNFFVTKVKYASDGSALHVYWTADSSAVASKLPKVAGKLRHSLTQMNICGRVPHINFIMEKSECKASDVEELLKRADFGDDYVLSLEQPSHSPASDLSTDKKLVKSTSVLDIDRNAIMNQVLRAMNHSQPPSLHKTMGAGQADSDFERQINFRKYLQKRMIPKSKADDYLSEDPLQDAVSSDEDDDSWVDEKDVEDEEFDVRRD